MTDHDRSSKEGLMRDRIPYRLTWLATALSLGHHLGHLSRGNAVGWPLAEEVNAFTASLVMYPVIATGLLLYRDGRVGPGFWALVSGGGTDFVSAVHSAPGWSNHPRWSWTSLCPADPGLAGVCLAGGLRGRAGHYLCETCVNEARLRWGNARPCTPAVATN
jgi:hypothetical protein